MTFLVVQGDAQQIPLADESVSCCITSPPYYGLRWYLPAGHPDTNKELGSEPTIESYVANLVTVFREVKRVLRNDACCFVNLGDSYNAAGRIGHGTRIGYKQGTNRASANGADNIRSSSADLKPKDLCMIPARVALALQADGWTLRSMIPWVKRNPMPESVEDRPTSAIEYIFMLTKSEKYYYDAQAVHLPHARLWDQRNGGSLSHGKGSPERVAERGSAGTHSGSYPLPVSTGRNRRNADWFFESWQGLLGDEDGDPLALVVNPAGFSGAHFATFPPKLVEPLIKAGSPKGGIVLDPFGGAGTVALVANKLGRNSISIDLSFDYSQMARDRITADAPLLHWGETAPVAVHPPRVETQSDFWGKE